MKELSLSHKLTRNTFFNMIGRVWGGLVSLGLTPYIIHRIGMERFGILAIAGLISGYFYLLDFGIGNSFTKYIAEFYTKKDYAKINQVVNTGISFYGIIAVIVLFLCPFLVKPIINLLRIPASLSREAQVVFWLMPVLFVMQNVFSAFSSVIDGLQRMDISNKIAMLVSLLQIAGTVYFLEHGYGIVGLVINNAIILIAASIVKLAVGFRIFPELILDLRLATLDMFKRLFSFGFKAQISGLAMLINNSIVKLLTSHFLNLSLVGLYELGQKIVMLARDIPTWSVNSINPAASECEARNDWQGIRELYLRVSKYLHLAVIYLTVLIFVTAPLIIRAWTGQELGVPVLVIRFLGPAYLVNMFTTIGAYIAYGVGKPGLIAKAWVATALFNLIISTILVVKVGFVGVVAGASVSLVIGSLIFIAIFNRYLKITFTSFFNISISRPLIASILPAVLVYLLSSYYIRQAAGNFNRLSDISFLSLSGVIFLCVYAISILKTGYLDSLDRSNIRSALVSLKLIK